MHFFTTIHLRRVTLSMLILFFVSLFLVCALPEIAGAQGVTYTPLVGIPQFDSASQGGNIAAYFNSLYLLAIAVGAIIAFVKISMAGVKYSMSGIVTDKSAAKEDIKGALLGMLILLAPFVILNTIYGNLTNLNILDKAPRVDMSTPQTTPTQALNTRVGDLCNPLAGGGIRPGCPANISPDAYRAAGYCDGFFDYNIKTCFTKGASHTYTTNVGGTHSVLAEEGWANLCGCTSGSFSCLNIVDSGNNRTISCK